MRHATALGKRQTSASAAARAAIAAAVLVAAAGCAGPMSGTQTASSAVPRSAWPASPSPDPRVGLSPGLFDAGRASWNMELVSATPPPKDFVGAINSDLAFLGHYAIQGNYDGYQVWDISDPSRPTLVVGYVCPASQSDVSVYKNLLFVSGEGLGGRLDCGAEGVRQVASPERLRGIRIFDITDIRNPRYVANVQTCRGSHTHSLLVDPKDPDNVYVYVSGSASVRPAAELAGCSGGSPDTDPNTALFRIEVIRVPLAHPEEAAIVSSPRIFQGLTAPPEHGQSPADVAAAEALRRRGGFVVDIDGQATVVSRRLTQPLLDSIVKRRGGSGPATSEDSAVVRRILPQIQAFMEAARNAPPGRGPTQCHDITLYPEIGRAGGACEGYGMLLDISDPTNPRRLAAVADSNFSYWHSATFSNDGSKLLFSDEWGGGGQPKCRASDPKEWGADALFSVSDDRVDFRGYYKMPAPQTSVENCVAHNGSLIPIPGRDVMVQSWYQGGVSVFDWTDPANPREIAFFDRGPVDAQRLRIGGSWSAYWYNGRIYSSEIARGLDVLRLEPSPFLTRNEIEAAESVRTEYKNVQGQQRIVWPPTFALARAYADQLERSGGLSAPRLTAVRNELDAAERASGPDRSRRLGAMADALARDAGRSSDSAKVRLLADAVRRLASRNAA